MNQRRGIAEFEDMNPEDRLLFTLSRQGFQAAHQTDVSDICRTHAIRWDMVYAIAMVHGVAPLVFFNCQQCGLDDLNIPREIIGRFKRGMIANVVKKETIAKRLTKLLALLNEYSLDVMLAKGAALDILVYDQPWYTSFNDVDLVVKAGKDDLPDQEYAEIRKMCRRFPVECDFLTHHDVTINGTLPVNFQRIWDDAAIINYRGHDVFVMSPEDLLIAVCINSCRKRFFRLKALCDIATILNKYDDLNWEILVNKAHEYDCRTIIFTALLVTELTVGCKIPLGVLDDLSAGPLKTFIIRYLSRRMSWSSLSTLYSGKKIVGRRISPSLILPCLTYRWYQLGRKINFVYHKRVPIIEPDVLDLVRA
ncbi:MAG TPA: nucleotidyltransferase family protein [Anaerolineae bacterium]